MNQDEIKEQNALWVKLQDLEWNMYKESPVGVFSVDGLVGAEVTGATIQEILIEGSTCLDIGCGALPLPSYMKAAPKIDFYGIDPYYGDEKRKFDFRQSFAEGLPFEDQCFDGVLFATSLDHCIKPCKAIQEAYRVLKPKGYLFVWATIRDADDKYQNWYNSPKPCQYDSYHMWVFTQNSMRYVLKDFSPIQLRMLSKYANGYEALIICQKPD